MSGRGGAPKFFLDWLTFAFSPYEPDHIPTTSASLRNDTLPLLHVDDSPSVLHKEVGNFSSKQMCEITIKAQENKRYVIVSKRIKYKSGVRNALNGYLAPEGPACVWEGRRP